MVNETGNSYWVYSFENDLPEGNEHYSSLTKFPVLFIYAHSEEEARRKFKHEFGLEAGKLHKRSPW